NEWLEVDFSQALDITHVELVNRNGWESRLDGAVVEVLDVNGTVIHTFPAISGVGRQEVLRLELPSTMTAGSIRIEHTSNFLHLAEVNVYGTPPAGTTLPARDTDLTLNGAATVRNTAPVVDLTPDNDTLHGEDGNDTISGGWGDDTLIGGRGSDTLNGGKGNDTLRGEGAIGEPPATAAIDMIRLNKNYVVSGSTSYDDHELRAAAKVSLPANAITVEMMLRTENLDGAYGTIMASSTGGEWDTMDFAIRVDAFNSRLTIHVAGNEYRTSIMKSAFDGTEARRLSVSWESSSGELNIYIDGNLVETGSVSQGANLTASTNLWFGSGWWHKFDIALGDIRVWDTVRSATEVYDNAFAPVSDPANTQGLTHNWQVNPADLTSLTDATGTSPVLNMRDITASNAPSAETGDFTDLFGFDDTLNGDEGDDILEGGRGADVIHGGGGVDTATYAASSAGVTVNLAGGLGSGGEATGDRLIQVEKLIGSAYTDVLRGSELANVIRGGEDNDTIDGGGGNDILFGDAGGDTIDGDTGNDSIFGGGGVDTITGGFGIDNLYGGAGGDIIEGGNDGDFIFGEDGNDFLFGDGGVDRLDGGIGVDNLYGGNDGDTLLGGTEGDFLFGESGNDILRGQAGDDRLDGGTGEDDLFGGTGNDRLFGGGNDDRLFGEDNDDILYGDGGADRLDGAAGDDDLYGGNAADRLFGGAGNDDLFGDQGADVIFGGDNVDNIYGGTENDILYGENGDDFVFGESGNDFLFGGAGIDRLDGGSGVDSLYGGTEGDTLLGGTEGDFLFGEAGTDVLRGQGGNDRLDGGDDGDELYGGGDNDILFGRSGNDMLFGDDGNDILAGGEGIDTLTGGTGVDTYVFRASRPGSDTVTDFEAGETVELNGFGYANAGAAAADFSQVGSDVVFNNGGVTVAFSNATLADVIAGIMIDAPASTVIAAPDTDAGAPMLIPPLAEDTFDFAGLSSGTSNATASLELDSVEIFESHKTSPLQREDDLGPVMDLGFDFAIFEDDGFLL
ncbi:MAG: LamG-like jellyroll fold domain-containing protein, partial [Pseudomonadota bacterium]